MTDIQDVMEITAERDQLKSELKYMREERDTLQAIIDNFDRTIAGIPALARAENLHSENVKIQAENESLRKDSARYQWTSTEGNWVARYHGKWRAHVGEYGVGQPTDWYPTREEAIDAAMSKEQSHD